jgi:hypothetical protein
MVDPTLAGLALGLAGIAAAAVPVVTGYLEKKRKADADEREKERQHEVDMRQAAIVQTLINTAQNYDFARDAIAGRETAGVGEIVETLSPNSTGGNE